MSLCTRVPATGAGTSSQKPCIGDTRSGHFRRVPGYLWQVPELGYPDQLVECQLARRLSQRAGTAPARQKSSQQAGTAHACQESSQQAGTATARQESSQQAGTAQARQESSQQAGTALKSIY
ncbi:hypothetical protein PCANC_16465 [Puccinia coronata f. sp. avenae]|uniref:Uncharacterized protein n=1 Tax=Puccinia coronata f. sp. avenae TaxID=200324 RepID=A0A2N5U6W8_9BASI|nr:hypothetical protein PCANC_16465 [Puccinia coronata f. sp. avenae]